MSSVMERVVPPIYRAGLDMSNPVSRSWALIAWFFNLIRAHARLAWALQLERQRLVSESRRLDTFLRDNDLTFPETERPNFADFGLSEPFARIRHEIMDNDLDGDVLERLVSEMSEIEDEVQRALAEV